jgi:hypothetical protein
LPPPPPPTTPSNGPIRSNRRPGAPNADAAAPARRINPIDIAITYTGLPKMPEIVAKGKPLPCLQCHLANGGSHPESAAIAGMSVNYIIEQVHAFRDGERVDVRTGRMVEAAQTRHRKRNQGSRGILFRDRSRPSENG